MATRAILEIASGPQQGKKVEVRPGQTVKVGRHEQADLVIREDALMSNVHFTLECDGPTCRIRDLKSRFGTHVNQRRVAEAVMQDGDRIVAGSTTFLVRIPGGATAPKTVDVPEIPTLAKVDAPATIAEPQRSKDAIGELAIIHDRVLQELRQQPEPLYALLDAARDPCVLALLLNSGEEYQSLYEGPKGEALAAFGPFLLTLPKTAPFLEVLVREGWGKSWGIFLICDRPFKDLQKHFRRFLMVTLPNKKEVYFRFYDPRVLRAFLPTLNPQEAVDFFGSVQSFIMEGESWKTLLKFSHEGRSVKREALLMAQSV